MSFHSTTRRGTVQLSPCCNPFDLGMLGRGGIGAVSTTQAINSAAGSAGTLIGAATGMPAVGSVVSAALSSVSSLIAGVINGCGINCEVTTQWANEAESALQQNISTYFSLPAPRSYADQQAALNNWMSVWNALVQQCGNPNLGAPGQRCITDRQEGSCTWHQTTTPPWGSPVAGACWNWKNGYYDPIANDPDVAAPSSMPAVGADLTSSVQSDITGALGSNMGIPLLIAAGLIVALVVIK